MNIYKQGYHIKYVQFNLLKILVEFDKICRKNKILYTLEAGTLLGIIRHGGFIPWDDDIDVTMERKEYNKFLKVIKKEPNNSDFILECLENTPFYEYSFAKFQLKHTSAIEFEGQNIPRTKGLWIDIFPLDRTNKCFYRLQSKFSNLWQYVRWVKIGYKTSMSRNKIVRLLAKICPLKLVNFFANVSMKIMNYFPTNKVDLICYPSRETGPIPKHIFGNYIEKNFHFENQSHSFLIVEQYEELLKLRYGDWRELPPLEERIPKHELKEFKL